MKILGVKFFNINSLQGQWEIRFDQPPLSDTGLFAIVGPNGSGKSSILDAISLGLYGATPRQKDPQFGVVSCLAEESFSEVDFAVGAERYRSAWRLRRGTDHDSMPEMWLLGGTEGTTVLAERVGPVRERVTAITGLDFKRFCRSIVLAQGEFAAFLKAPESERLDILSTIVGAEMMAELADSIRARAAAAQAELDQLKERVGEGLDSGRIEEVRRAVAALEAQLKETEDSLEHLRELESWADHLEQLETERQQVSAELIAAEAHCAELERQVVEAEGAAPAATLEGPLERLDGLEAALFASRKRTAELKQRHEDLVEQIDQRDRRLNQVREQLDQARSRLSRQLESLQRQRQAACERELAKLDREEADLHRRLAQSGSDLELKAGVPELQRQLVRLVELRRRLADRAQRRDALARDEQRAARELGRIKSVMAKLQAQIERFELRRAERLQRVEQSLAGRRAREWASLARTQRKKLALCRKLLDLSKRYQALGIEPGSSALYQSTVAAIAAMEQSLGQEQERLAALAERLEQRDRTRRLATERVGIGDGRPCPLCGSTVHPFIEGPLPDFSELDRAELQHRRTIETLTRQLESFRARAGELSRRIASGARLQAAWTALCGRAGYPWPEPDPALVSEEQGRIQAAIKDCRVRVRAARRSVWQGLWSGWSLRRRQAKLDHWRQRHRQHQDRYEQIRRALAEMDADLEILRGSEHLLRSQLDAGLEPFGQRCPAAGEEADCERLLQNRGSIVENLMKDRERLAQRRKDLEQARSAAAAADLDSFDDDPQAAGALAPLRQALEQRSAEQAALEAEIERLRRQAAEDERACAQWGKEVLRLESAVADLREQVLRQVAAAGLEDLDQARHRLALAQELAGRRRDHQAAEQALAGLRAREQELLRNLDRLKGEPKTTESLAGLRRRREDLLQQRETLRETLTAHQDRLAELEADLRERAEVLRALAEKERLAAEAKAEQRLLDTDAGAMRSRLERLMLDRLLALANGHLAVVSRRYQLATSDQNGRALMVRDGRQNGTLRALPTLSGGETFLLSLCLALGLAEMAGRDRKALSFFLDEGFGTLDEDNLCQVIAALKALHADGKSIGVISHVSRLADEIPTQVQMEKLPGGFSRLKLRA